MGCACRATTSRDSNRCSSCTAGTWFSASTQSHAHAGDSACANGHASAREGDREGAREGAREDDHEYDDGGGRGHGNAIAVDHRFVVGLFVVVVGEVIALLAVRSREFDLLFVR